MMINVLLIKERDIDFKDVVVDLKVLVMTALIEVSHFVFYAMVMVWLDLLTINSINRSVVNEENAPIIVSIVVIVSDFNVVFPLVGDVDCMALV